MQEGRIVAGIKVELHCHTRLLGRQPWSRQWLIGICRRARQLGLDRLAITEHADIPGFWDVFSFLDDNGWRWQDLQLLAGCEITVAEAADILVLGTPADLLDLKSCLGSWPSGHDHRPPLEDLLGAANNLGMLTVGAHPFRPGRQLAHLPENLLRRLDALEINARELERSAAVADLARRLDLPLVGGSDAHIFWQVGRVINLLPAGSRDMAVWRAAISRGENHILVRQRNGYASLSI